MLPAIVVILFCQGAISAAHFVSSQRKDEHKIVAAIVAIILGIVPAWQTAEVWNRATSPLDLPSLTR